MESLGLLQILTLGCLFTIYVLLTIGVHALGQWLTQRRQKEA